MIKFLNLTKQKPYTIFFEKYQQALKAKQKNIEAISVASFNSKKKEIDTRFVNLKHIEDDKFIFFTNYESSKAKDFNSHSQIAVAIFWSSINFQIRMKAKIKKTSQKYNREYFRNRAQNKNALSISSNQSQKIASYDNVKEKYNYSKKNHNLSICPSYWGGYSFKPYEIEFWTGNDSRINERNLYTYKNGLWVQSILEP